MTVTFLGENPGGRKATNDQGSRTYSRDFLLESDDQADGPYAVGSNASLPVIGSVHPEDSDAYCDKITVTNHEPWKGWKVTCSYSDKRELSNQGTAEGDEVLVSCTSELFQEPVWQDASGEGVVNSAGDVFIDPSVTRDAANLIFKIKSNHQSIPSWVLQYVNSVNASACTIEGLSIDPFRLKVQRIEVGERKIRNGVPYYPLTTEIHYHERGWRAEILDAGLRERNANDELVHIRSDGDNEFVTQPVMLDGAGSVLADPSPSNAEFRKFQLYPELQFSALPGIT